MAKNIGVDTSIMGRDIDTLRSHLAAIQSGMDKMYGQVKTLDAGWEGPANREFDRQFMQDKKDMETVCQTIGSIIQSMENARKEYDSCESTVGSIVSAIRI